MLFGFGTSRISKQCVTLWLLVAELPFLFCPVCLMDSHDIVITSLHKRELVVVLLLFSLWNVYFCKRLILLSSSFGASEIKI